jgi:cardiolipin synthase
LSFTKLIPWKYTVLVFSRDLFLILITAVLYITTSIRDFRPSIFGKLNTGAQIGAIFFVLSWRINPAPWIGAARGVFLVATLILTCLSAFHYILITGQKLHASGEAGPPPPPSR